MNKIILSVFAGISLSCTVSMATAEVVAVVASSSNVKQLSAAQIADIFLGKTSRFPDGSAAIPVDQAESSAERAEFYTRYAGKSAVEMKMHWSKLIFTGRGQPPRELQDPATVKALLANNPAAISYLDRSEVDATLTVLLLTER
jgi:ABC-type phosphate transport system substrate-binding protein